MMRTRRDSVDDFSSAGLAAYGSLVAQASLAHTLGHDVDPPRRLKIPGWRRAWTNIFRDPGRAYLDDAGRLVVPAVWHYLDIEPDPSSVLEVAVYRLTPEDFRRLDLREIGYDRVVLEGVTETVWAYRAQPASRASLPREPEKGAVAASYLELVESGHLALGYDLNTLRAWRPPAELIVEDRVVPSTGE